MRTPEGQWLSFIILDSQNSSDERPLRNHIPHYTMIYGSFISLAGTINIKLHVPEVGVVEITDFGSLKYEFDLTPDSVDIKRLQALYSKASFTVFQYFREDGVFVDIVDTLQAEILQNRFIDMEVEIITPEEQNYVFKFEIRAGDIKLTESARLVTINGRSKYNENLTALKVFNEIDGGDYVDFTHKGNTFAAISTKQWIQKCLELLFDNEFPHSYQPAILSPSTQHSRLSYPGFDEVNDGVIAFVMVKLEEEALITDIPTNRGIGTLFYEIGVSTNVITGLDTFFTRDLVVGARILATIFDENWTPAATLIRKIVEIVSDTELIVDANYELPIGYVNYSSQRHWSYQLDIDTESFSAIEVFQDMAGIEGAIFGTGFSKNFYLNRIRDGETVTIDFGDIIDSGRQPYFSPLTGNVVQTIIDYDKDGPSSFGDYTGDDGIPNLSPTGAESPGAKSATSSLDIALAPGYPFMCKGQVNKDGGTVTVDGSYTIAEGWQSDEELERNICIAGLTAYLQALATRGERQVIEFEVFKATKIKPWDLVSFENAPDKYSDRKFRPTSLEYDFVADTVKVTAYEIETIPDWFAISGEILVEANVSYIKHYAQQAVGEIVVEANVTTAKHKIQQASGEIVVEANVNANKVS